MKLSDLRRTHPLYDLDTLTTYGDLFAGGAQFRRNVTRYLPQHDHEETTSYMRRLSSAHYLNYVSSICNYFASWLWTRKPSVKIDGAHPTEFYEKFQSDCDDRGTDIDAFVRDRFVDALVSRRSYWRVEFPDPIEGTAAVDSRAVYEDAGTGRACVVQIPTKNIVHWKRDKRGAFVWVVEHTLVEELAEFDATDATTAETWTLWRADGDHKRWQVEYAAGKKPPANTIVPEIDPPYDPTRTIPIVELELPVELWVLNLLADAQLELFRKRNALSWAMDRTCYAVAVLKAKGNKPLGKMGAGRYLRLQPDDDLSWPAPPSTPFDVIGAYCATLKDELHRVASQMAQGVDNNAAAVGRSAESKATDNSATEIVLEAFGGYVREAIERTFDLIALGRQEPETFTVDVQGCDHYHVADLDTLTENAVAGELLKIPSTTLKIEVFKRIARGFLPGADEAKLAEVDAQIEAGVTAAEKTPPAVNTATCAACGASTAADATECQLCGTAMADAPDSTEPPAKIQPGTRTRAAPPAQRPMPDVSATA